MDTMDTMNEGTGGPGSEPGAVFVTGASGYLGRLLVERLAGTRPLVAADLRPVPEQERLAGVDYVVLDIRDASAVAASIGAQRVEVVVHLAALVTPPKGDHRELAYDVDVHGTRHVLDACLLHQVPKIIVTSSGAAYGYHPDNAALLTEDDPLRGNEVFAYSHHKRLVELMLADYRERHPELKQLVFRPGTILGPSAKNQITAIFERPVILGLRESASPFVFILDQDVVSCLERGVHEAALTGIYNLAGDGAMTLSEIAKALRKPYIALPARLVREALGLMTRLGIAPYGPEQVLFLMHRPVLDNRRLREDFGFTPTPSREVFELYRQAHTHARPTTPPRQSRLRARPEF